MKKDGVIKQALSEIAKEGTKGHTDPWPRLRDRIEPRRSRIKFHLSRRFVLLLIVVALTTAAAGAYYYFIDPGLQKVDQEGLVLHLNQTAAPTVFSAVPTELSPANKVSQTYNGITVTLDWAYADELRVAWQLTVTGLSIPKGAMVSDYICDPYVTTKEDIPLNPIPGYNSSGNPLVISYISYQKIDASRYDHLDIALDLTVGPCAMQWDHDYGHAYAGPTSTPVPLIGNYHLVFQVPVKKGVTITPDQTVEANGIKMRLETIATAPSYTMARLCYEVPSVPDLAGNVISGGDWSMTGVTLQSGNNDPIQADDYFSLPEYERPGYSENCVDVGFAAQVDLQATKVVVAVASLEGIEDENDFLDPKAQANAQAKLAQQGLEVAFGSYGNDLWKVLKKPAGMTDEQANEIVVSLLNHEIVGHWEFVINR